MTEGGFHATRGRLVDIGGRRLRAVRNGPPDGGPLVVLESGSFGCAADWAVVQDRLSAKRLPSLAYDRAGLGYSDPGSTPRDGRAVAEDLEALLARMGEGGPLIYVGHSMAGLLARVFAPRNAERVVGVVLIDAVTPEMIEEPRAAAAIHAFRGATRLAGAAAWTGFMAPVSLLIGDTIGLEGEARTEKRRIYGSARHTRWAAREVHSWPRTSALGRAAGRFAPDLPVAVVLAGDERGGGAAFKALQAAPARASLHGRIDHVNGARHADLLGRRFADSVVRGIEHVLAHARV